MINLSKFCVNRVVGKGFVRLVDILPREVRTTGDEIITMAARVSYGDGTRSVSDDRALIDYMWRHGHSSPFEMATMVWHVSAPMFVARQWFRHRAGSYNEESARYSIVRDVMWDAPLRAQSADNKQGSADAAADFLHEHDHVYKQLQENCRVNYERYLKLVEAGASREQVRAFLPVGMYTQWYWKVDLRNLFNFLQQRLDPHAQREIREYAAEIFEMIRPIFPHSVEAFEVHTLDAVRLSSRDVDALRNGADKFRSARERREFNAKHRRLVGWIESN